MKNYFAAYFWVASALPVFSQAPTPVPPPLINNRTEAAVEEAPASHPLPVSLRIVGSNLMNPQGQYLGRIEEVLLSPSSSQIEFALVSTGSLTNPVPTPLTPVPWSKLTYVWDQSKVGGVPGAIQTFTLPTDKARLDAAPKISRSHRNEFSREDWSKPVYAYFGGVPTAVGAAGSDSASTGGTAAGGPVIAPAAGVTGAPAYYGEPDYYNGFPGYVWTGTNYVVNTNLPTANNPGGIFPGGPNVFRGTTNPYPGGSVNGGIFNNNPANIYNPSLPGAVAPGTAPVQPPTQAAPFNGPAQGNGPWRPFVPGVTPPPAPNPVQPKTVPPTQPPVRVPASK